VHACLLARLSRVSRESACGYTDRFVCLVIRDSTLQLKNVRCTNVTRSLQLALKHDLETIFLRNDINPEISRQRRRHTLVAKRLRQSGDIFLKSSPLRRGGLQNGTSNDNIVHRNPMDRKQPKDGEGAKALKARPYRSEGLRMNPSKGVIRKTRVAGGRERSSRLRINVLYPSPIPNG
jgi:hypothetical protein